MPASTNEMMAAMMRLPPMKTPSPRVMVTQMLGREPLVHEADGEGVRHGQAAYEAAGFAGKG